MVNIETRQNPNIPDSQPSSSNGKKHYHVIENTYQSNTNSDYTEKIEALGNNFDYQSIAFLRKMRYSWA
jgi:hypothetical protein